MHGKQVLLALSLVLGLVAQVSAGPLLERLQKLRAERRAREAGQARTLVAPANRTASGEGGVTKEGRDVFVLPGFPADIEAFRALRREIAGTPEGGLLCFLVAAKLYTTNRALGEEALALSVGPLNLDRHPRGPATLCRAFRDQLGYLDRKPWLVDSCFLGTKQSARYRLGSPPHRVRIFEGPQAAMNERDRRLMVENAGALPRPFLMTPVEGEWVLQDRGSSLFVDVRKAGARPVELPVEVKGGSYWFRSLPADVEAFRALQTKLATRPGGGAVMFCLAARLYVENERLGLEAFAEALDASLVSAGSPIAGFTFHLSRLKTMPWMAELFIRKEGDRWVARTGKGTAAPPDAVRVPVELAGKNAPRDFSVRRDEKGIWKVKDAYSNLFRGAIRP